MFLLRPSRQICTAAKRFIASRWSHMLEAVISHREKRWAIPESVGKNWGLKPPLRPASRLPGNRISSVSGFHDAYSKNK